MPKVTKTVAFSWKPASLKGAGHSDNRVGASSSAIRCNWIKTGDPARPLSCRWTDES